MDKEPVQACLELVEECDLFIGIYAWRYGYIPDGSDLSITEQEHQYAKSLGRPCLCYFIDEKYPWIPGFIEEGPAKEKLKLFKNKIEKEHVRATFKEPLHLENNIIRDLSNWLVDNEPNLKRDALKPGQDPVKKYMQAIAEKYSTLSMVGGVKRNFAMDDIYIPLTVHLDPESRNLCRSEEAADKLINHQLQAEDLLELTEKVVVVLGEPGMGKTTMLHHLALRVSKKSKAPLPILVRLADFCKTREPFESFLLTAVENYISGDIMRNAALTAIQKQNALILLDGLDEVNREEYISVTERIRDFIAGHLSCRVIITSRKAGFQSNEVPYTIFEIDKLPMEQIAVFIDKWFVKETDLAQRIKTT